MGIMCLLSLPEFWELNSDLQSYVTSAFIHQVSLPAWEFCLKIRIFIYSPFPSDGDT